jgi:hypothetical protein
MGETMTTENYDRDRLIEEALAYQQQAFKGAYEVGQGLLAIKEHETHETFVKVLNDFGLTEIEGEAIVKNMRILDAPKIVEIMLNASMRLLEKMEKENVDE